MSNDRLTEIEGWLNHQPCCDHSGADEHGCWDCLNTGCAHQTYVDGRAKADLADLVAIVREVEKIHRPTSNAYHPDDPPCCFEDAEIWPCPTASALQKLGGTA